jgi:hypothetical protein
VGRRSGNYPPELRERAVRMSRRCGRSARRPGRRSAPWPGSSRTMVIFVAIVASMPVMGYLHGTDHLSYRDQPQRADRRPAPPIWPAAGSQVAGSHHVRPRAEIAHGRRSHPATQAAGAAMQVPRTS